jgi:hypothetical protein
VISFGLQLDFSETPGLMIRRSSQNGLPEKILKGSRRFALDCRVKEWKQIFIIRRKVNRAGLVRF